MELKPETEPGQDERMGGQVYPTGVIIRDHLWNVLEVEDEGLFGFVVKFDFLSGQHWYTKTKQEKISFSEIRNWISFIGRENSLE